MRKLLVSTKILIVAATVAVGGYYGKQALSNAMIGNLHFAPIAPGQVNLVGINPGAGYRIIVANDIAQLVETQGGFGAGEKESEGPTEGAIKKRVPMKELLGVLRGDGKALGPFVMIMNGIQEKEDWSPIRVNWKMEDIEKAIGGDSKLKAKLEHDLSVHLDGSPVVPLNRNSLENGIFVIAPIELSVNIGGKPTPVRGEITQPYKPGFIKAVEAHYQDKANVDNKMIGGYYADEAQNLLKNPGSREDVAKSLRAIYSHSAMEERLKTPHHLLSNATVVVNDSFVSDSSYKAWKTNDGHTLCDLTVDLNDEGRQRLWKYSKDHVGDQILLIASDVAIAAPRIEHELALSEFTITQMPDEVLVREAVDTIRASKGHASTVNPR